MSDPVNPSSASLIILGCCLIVLGSRFDEYMGPWHYLFYIGAIALFVLAIVRDVKN